VTTRGVTLAALLAALGRPSWWLLALAGFLVRGGALLFLLAIVSLPSPLIVSNLVAPLIVPLVLGQIDSGTLAFLVLGVGLVGTGLIGGGWLAAAIEVVLIRDARAAMAEEGIRVRAAASPRRPVVDRWVAGRVAAVRLLAHVPTALVLAIASVRIAGVGYLELTNPSEVATPLAIRIVIGAAGPIGAVVLVWLLGEIVGGLAARSIVLLDASVLGGLRGALGDAVRKPAGMLLPALVTVLVLAIDLGALLATVSFVWRQLRERLVEPANTLSLTSAVLAFAGAWVGALVLTGLIDAWRSAAMTFEAERTIVADTLPFDRDPDPGGTFGASAGRRPGDWSTGDEGGSL
jgi:hypothetical protein